MAKSGTYQALKSAEANGQVFFDYFIYNAKVASLAPGAQAVATVQIQADSTFIWDKSAIFAALAGAAQTKDSQVLPQIDVTIQDSGSGRLLQDTPVQVSSVCGDGELPFVLSQPRLFSPNSTITVTLTNTSAAETYTNIQLSLIGRKVFRY